MTIYCNTWQNGGPCTCPSSVQSHSDAATLMGGMLRHGGGLNRQSMRAVATRANYTNWAGFLQGPPGDQPGTATRQGWIGEARIGGMYYMTRWGVDGYAARRHLDRDQSPLPRFFWQVTADGRAVRRETASVPGLAEFVRQGVA